MNKIAKIAGTAVLALTVGVLGGCGSGGAPAGGGDGDNTKINNFMSAHAMGTDAVLIAEKSAQDKATMSVAQINESFAALSEDVRNLLADVENSISSSVTTSYIYRYNTAFEDDTPAEERWVEVDEVTYNLLSTAKEIYDLTDGSYNPAVWYSVDLYGFTTRPAGTPSAPYDRDKPYENLPDDRYVAAFRQLAQGFEDFALRKEGDKYYAYKPTTYVTVDGVKYYLRLDLGGIGKGYVADRVYELMTQHGFPFGYFNFGSSSIAVRQYAGKDSGEYTLSARDPKDMLFEGPFCTFTVKDTSLSTSGDYEKYYTIEGVQYCHIIDPSTGSPIRTGISSVTVVGGSAAEDDAITTAISVMGKERAVQFINDNPEFFADRIVVFLVFEGGEGKVITNVPDKVTITNDDYKLSNRIEGGKIVLL